SFDARLRASFPTRRSSDLQAEALGVDIFPGFAAAHILYDDNGAVRGVLTGDMGVARDGTHTAHYQPGMELLASYTIFAEGSRGRSEEHTSELQSRENLVCR